MLAHTPVAFLRAFFITLIAILVISATIIQGTTLLGRPSLPYEKIYRYQIAKLSTPNVSQLFIGDSSLGNSVNAELWSALTKEKTLNLALTGSFGYEGSYWMLRRALTAGMKPKIVYLMQTSDMMTRKPVENDLLAEISQATGPALLAAWWRKRMNVQELNSALSWIMKSLSGERNTRQEFDVVNDFIQQGTRLDERKIPAALHKSDIVLEKAHYLSLFASLCKANGIECVYVHGPLAEPACNNSMQYFEVIDRVIESTGVRLARPLPRCIPYNELGDAVDHVSPSKKDEFTRSLFIDLGNKIHVTQ